MAVSKSTWPLYRQDSVQYNNVDASGHRRNVAALCRHKFDTPQLKSVGRGVKTHSHTQKEAASRHGGMPHLATTQIEVLKHVCLRKALELCHKLLPLTIVEVSPQCVNSAVTVPLVID